MVKTLPVNAGDMDLIPGLRRSSGATATHSSIPARGIPWSLAGYSPWGHKESDTTEHAHVVNADIIV